MNKGTFLNKILNIYTVLGFFLILFSLVLIFIPISPYIWYRLDPQATQKDEEKIFVEVVEEKESIEEEEKKNNIPPFDASLPEGYFVVIPSIGVNSPISDAKDYNKALLKGSWIIPDYGTPEQDSLPIILAAHRFGYTSWTKEIREKISFYNLPNLKEGDKVHIYWNQRDYEYSVYFKEESTYISDYNSDLILYTCKYFNSPVRIFVYADR